MDILLSNKRAFAAMLMAASAGLLAPTAARADSPWFQYGGNGAGTWFNSQEATLGAADLPQLRQIWSNYYASDGRTPVVAADQKVYAAGDSPDLPPGDVLQLRRIDAATGKVEWNVAAKKRLEITAIALTEEFVLATGEVDIFDSTLQIVAFNKDTGQEVWSTLVSAPNTQDGSIMKIEGDTAYVLVTRPYLAAIWALNTKTGDVRWSTEYLNNSSEYLVAGMAVAGGRVFLTHTYGIAALDARNGRLLWNRNGAETSRTDPVVVGDSVFLLEGAEWVESVNADNGRLQWRVKAPCSQPRKQCRGIAVASDGQRVFTSTNTYQVDTYNYVAKISALDPITGRKLWSSDSIPGSVYGNLAIANGVLYFSSLDSIIAIDVTGGALLPTANVGISYDSERLVIGDGRIFSQSYYEGLRAIAP